MKHAHPYMQQWIETGLRVVRTYQQRWLWADVFAGQLSFVSPHAGLSQECQTRKWMRQRSGMRASSSLGDRMLLAHCPSDGCASRYPIPTLVRM